MNESHRSTWLLESLFTGRHRRWQPLGSQVIGLLGLMLYAVVTVVIAAFLFGSIDPGLAVNRFSFAAAVIATILAAAMLYIAVLFTSHWFASCQLPLTLRLALIYTTIYFGLQIVAANAGDRIEGAHVLLFAPFCGGGLIQFRRGWRALAWQQKPRGPKRLNIRMMMDITAAVALTIATMQTVTIKEQSFACLLPASAIMAVVGMHTWGRLTRMCQDQDQRDVGFMMWAIGNAIAAVCLFITFAGLSGHSPAMVIMGLLLIPMLLLSLQLWTALSIAWLRACGWRFEKVDANNNYEQRNDFVLSNPRSR
ncbi:MAG: hypothetical protein HKN47_05585 [Pirellulaceae bacterium]|nr:hypothetical protein [Pirellulaceae bacterium]